MGETADGRTAVLPARPADAPLRLGAVLVPEPSREARRLEVRRLGAMEGLQELLRHPRLTMWRASEPIGRLFELTAEIAQGLPVYRARVPWGPPFPPGLAEELLASVGLGAASERAGADRAAVSARDRRGTLDAPPDGEPLRGGRSRPRVPRSHGGAPRRDRGVRLRLATRARMARRARPPFPSRSPMETPFAPGASPSWRAGTASSAVAISTGSTAWPSSRTAPRTASPSCPATSGSSASAPMGRRWPSAPAAGSSRSTCIAGTAGASRSAPCSTTFRGCFPPASSPTHWSMRAGIEHR